MIVAVNAHTTVSIAVAPKSARERSDGYLEGMIVTLLRGVNLFSEN